jgi:hypothetical protein
MPFMNRLLRNALLTTLLILPAHATMACQLVCMVTNQTYSGNLGGLGGADAICDGEFKGFKFARSLSVLANLPGGAPSSGNRIYVHNTVNGWVGRDPDETNPPGGSDSNGAVGVSPYPGASLVAGAWVHGPNHCTNWSSAAFGDFGRISGAPYSSRCNAARPLLCCNLNM